MNHKEEAYWTDRYKEHLTGWDIGYPSTPLKTYIDQLDNKDIKILIPGAGNGYEAEYLYKQGFINTYVLDISKKPLEAYYNRVPGFPLDQLVHGDFFEQAENNFDLILEQTFFCSFQPTKDNRSTYASQMHQLLADKGKLVGLWFMHELFEGAKRPFGGSKEEYLKYLSPYFDIQVFEDCKNSITPRMGKELFGIFCKK